MSKTIEEKLRDKAASFQSTENMGGCILELMIVLGKHLEEEIEAKSWIAISEEMERFDAGTQPPDPYDKEPPF